MYFVRFKNNTQININLITNEIDHLPFKYKCALNFKLSYFIL